MIINIAYQCDRLTFKQIFNADRPKERPQEIPIEIWPLYYVAYSFGHNRIFSVLYVLGLCLDTTYIRLFDK